MKELLTQCCQDEAMANDETISDLPLAQRASRYKLLAEDASQLASEATGHARQACTVLAEKSRIRGEETEAALVGQGNAEAERDDEGDSDNTNELPFVDPRRRRTGMERRQHERRREHELRKTIDDVDRMAAEARESAAATEIPAERSRLMTAAQALAGLRAMLTGRKPNP